MKTKSKLTIFLLAALFFSFGLMGEVSLSAQNFNSNDWYYISCEWTGTKRVLEVNSSDEVYLGRVSQTHDEQWKFVKRKNGWYKIINREYGENYCLTHSTVGDGKGLIVQKDNGYVMQSWWIKDMGDGYVWFYCGMDKEDSAMTVYDQDDSEVGMLPMGYFKAQGWWISTAERMGSGATNCARGMGR